MFKALYITLKEVGSESGHSVGFVMPREGKVSELSNFQSKTSTPVKKLCIVACVCSPDAWEWGLKRP